MRASERLHHKALGKVLSAPMRYFDTTPLGSLVQRFSSDLDQAGIGGWFPPSERRMLFVVGGGLPPWVYRCALHPPILQPTPKHPSTRKSMQVDQQLPGTLGMLITCVLQILGAMAAVLTATPAFALAVFPLSWVRGEGTCRVSGSRWREGGGVRPDADRPTETNKINAPTRFNVSQFFQGVHHRDELLPRRDAGAEAPRRHQPLAHLLPLLGNPGTRCILWRGGAG